MAGKVLCSDTNNHPLPTGNCKRWWVGRAEPPSTQLDDINPTLMLQQCLLHANALNDKAASHNFVRPRSEAAQLATTSNSGETMGKTAITVHMRDLETTAVAPHKKKLCEDAILHLPWLADQNTITKPPAKQIHFGTRKHRTVYNRDS
ncbi:hypothetical protein PR048_015908 [Dryococelus australis]|uniref:Prolactin receptor n=1 Tax=Dryococelus australis TaxID=614101 RepID=A0ABQ9HI91_9NEOP|nr:hypothetical protein PR048_015908 [Dryococelus australis]